MRTSTRVILFTIAISLWSWGPPVQAAIMIFDSAAYFQNFDTLASTGSSSATPFGWAFAETGSSANTFYAAGTGSLTTGNTYSFGSTGSSDRALGELTSESLRSTIGVSFTNGSSPAIESLSIEYWGEQWRIGNTGAARSDRLDFQYSLDATSLVTGTWIDLDTLDFLSPITSASSVGVLDGNDPANRTKLNSVLSGLSIDTGDTIWIRWQSIDIGGSDDGLAVDDFSLAASFVAVPEPSSVAFLLTAGLGTAVRHRRPTRRRMGRCARQA
jgi:hypothetical protein